MSGADELHRALDELAQSCRTVGRRVKPGLMAAEFIREHIYSGKGFAPLSAATAAYRGQGRPLQDTGALRDSITSEQLNDTTSSVGTTKVYAPLQNNGGVVRPRKAKWLWIPAAGTRRLQRRYGHSVREVLDGLKSEGFSVYRAGRTVCYRKKGAGKKSKATVAFYLKQSVTVPARRFFYLTDGELDQIMEEVGSDIL